MNNYIVFHSHDDMSLLDSCTKYEMYIQRAKELGMNAFAISNHGNFFNWVSKKQYCDKNEIKYIHAQEFYVTKSIETKIRDNHHAVLIAKNYEGVKELNKLSSNAYKKDSHFYYDARITLDELIHTSENIIVSTACLGGLLNSEDDDVRDIFLQFLIGNKNRCFLEIQHHQNQEQIVYNKRLYELNKKYNINLIAGTDTHNLNAQFAELRIILQKSKNINYSNEESWDLNFKTYDELVECYADQNALPKVVYLEAIENTNLMNSMVEDFKLDYTYKYPKIYENSEVVFRQKIYEGLKAKGLENNQTYKDKIEYEIKAIAKNGAIDYLLLQEKITSWCHENDIFTGPSRGSVAGSICAYLLGITEIDSIKFGMNFERFMNEERVSLSDIDLDYPPNKRDAVKDFIFNKLNLNCCDIVAFNTVATKGAIRDVGRAFEIPLPEINEICKVVDNETEYYAYKEQYPKLFKYAELLQGTIVSVGTHPCGILTSQRDIEEEIGLFTTSTDNYLISQIDMKCIDSLNFVKLDILGLDNVQAINETCKLAGIERINPDNVNFDDDNIWNDILESSLGVFQWESDFAHQVYKRLFNPETLKKIELRVGKIDKMSLLSMANGAIRPAGFSYRDKMCDGEFNDNGHPALNELLKDTMGFLVYQEDVLNFLHQFCGYTMGMADLVRRGFAKKSGTEQFIPEIKSGFIKTMKEKYGVSEEESEKLIESFLTVIEDASSYLFSLNHSYPYSIIGYMCAYLRYYYKLEYLTTLLNINKKNIEKSAEIIEYAKHSKILVKAPKFRFSKDDYFFDKETRIIYKNIDSIKFVSGECSEQLYSIKDLIFDDFVDLLIYVEENLKVNSRQMETLIKIGFFDEFGKNETLFIIYETFSSGEFKYNKKLKQETKDKRLKAIRNHALQLKNVSFPVLQQIQFEQDILGYISTTYPIDKRYVFVQSVDTRFAPRVEVYCLANGKTNSLKIQKRTYDNNLFYGGEILYCKHFIEKNAVKFVDGKYIEDEKANKVWWLDSYSVINPEDFDQILQNSIDKK